MLSRGNSTSICSPAALVIVRFLVVRSSFQVRMTAGVDARFDGFDARPEQPGQRAGDRVMLAKSSDGRRSRR